MKPSVYIVISVSSLDLIVANAISALVDYEPESLGSFFRAYNESGLIDEPAQFYVEGLHVRPWTKASIQALLSYRENGVPDGTTLTPVLQEIIDLGGLPDSFVLHEESNVADAATSLNVKPLGSTESEGNS